MAMPARRKNVGGARRIRTFTERSMRLGGLTPPPTGSLFDMLSSKSVSQGHRMCRRYGFSLYLLLAALATSAAAAPAPPGSVETTPLSPTQVRVYWSPPPGSVTGYRVLRDGQPVAEVGSEARSYDDRELAPGPTYQYQGVALMPVAPPRPEAAP